MCPVRTVSYLSGCSKPLVLNGSRAFLFGRLAVNHLAEDYSAIGGSADCLRGNRRISALRALGLRNFPEKEQCIEQQAALAIAGKAALGIGHVERATAAQLVFATFHSLRGMHQSLPTMQLRNWRSRRTMGCLISTRPANHEIIDPLCPHAGRHVARPVLPARMVA